MEFRKDGFLSTGKLSAATIFDHRRVCHSVLPKRGYKIVVDGIASLLFHPEIRRSGDLEIWRSGDPEIEND
jgi:hypothetical protein